MMSNELAEIFILLIFGFIGTFASWRAWTQKQVNYRNQCYRREDSPFAFWFILTFQALCTVLLILFAIVFSISLLRSSWRTVSSTPRTQGLQAHLAPLERFPEMISRTAHAPLITVSLAGRSEL